MDLKGKRLAYIQGSTTHYMLEGFLEQTALSVSDLEWVGHMTAADQKAAWDKGTIDAGYMWGPNMRHLQNNAWCSTPDAGTACAAEGVNQTGYDLFTAGMSKRWGKETWNNLVVSDAFAAEYANTVYRSVKVVSLADTKLVEDKGWFSNDNTKVCGISFATEAFDCDSSDRQTVRDALYYDVWLDYETQQSNAYMGEKVEGACAKEAIGTHPNNDGACTRDTMAGSAWSTWATAEFGYKLKDLPYLPSYAYYQSTLDSRYIGVVGTPDDRFPNLTVDDLAGLSYYSLESPNSSNHCGSLVQPIQLSSPGVFRDHDGGGFYEENATCYPGDRPSRRRAPFGYRRAH
ncbi:unnamed protein product [Prorocentrum cordatum]|uniref:Thiamine pyrimidine synthase n=1 Tax=Prorocentrum cordatum TaxID=2364126 RepID=A0ABN9V0M1_9DINO|nr:unnamed protein product [Polarella glacialis]